VDLYFDLLGELTAQIFDMNSSPAIHIRWIFAAHQTHSQGKPPANIPL
jgi:hypothetical protein